jgi:hypothetical protein
MFRLGRSLDLTLNTYLTKFYVYLCKEGIES